jgi:hypothetical protein
VPLEPCFLADDNWQDLAAFLRMEDSQKQSEWAFYINVYDGRRVQPQIDRKSSYASAIVVLPPSSGRPKRLE